MSLLRSSLLAGAAALFALPASAQISADALWKSWEALSKDSGYELTHSGMKQDGNRLTLRDVRLSASAEGLNVVNHIDEVVLQETAGRVEVTMSPEWRSEMNTPDGSDTPSVTTYFQQSGYLVTVSGSLEAPQYDFKADHLSFAQKMPVADGDDAKANGEVNTNGTLTSLTGQFNLGAGAAAQLAYDLAVKELKVAVKSTMPESRIFSSFTLSAADLKSDFKGAVPAAATAGTDLNSLMKAGFQGLSESLSGPVRWSVDVTAPDSPFKGEGGFSSTRTKFAASTDNMTLELDLNGVEAGAPGATPSNSNVLLSGTAVLDPAATSDDEIMKAGKIAVTITESQALLDRLSAAGLIPADQMMGLQMMLAMFSVPGDTPGSISASAEMTEDGNILVNGTPMQ